MNWRPVVGFEDNYEVSDEGQVRTKERRVKTARGSRLVPAKLRKFDTTSGYYDVVLFLDGVGTTKLVHRLVAEAFLPNPDGLEVVNHKDGNKQNNCVENLEWCSRNQNDLHASLKGLRPGWQKHKPVKCLETGQFFESREDAGRKMGVDAGSVLNSINSGKPSKGFTFVEAPEYLDVLSEALL